ncbi:hypothetical protein [Vulcanisaeta distributa]|uniref:hypothetical protein n=1 Tax=Vulcanisaeta distributa TaxID=164451 RepID=UPI0006D0930C|nr:hypothetical protein [Vulcanisaeta distributa]
MMPLVRPAVEFLSDAGRVNECMALKLLMVNNEITPLTEILLVGPVMGYTSPPVLDALAEGRSGDVERDLGEFIRVIEDGRERNRGSRSRRGALRTWFSSAYGIRREGGP